MQQRTPSFYADTSIFGGVFDAEFADASSRFLDLVKSGVYELVTSELVREELEAAPERVASLFAQVLPHCELAEIEPDALALRDAYLREGILTEKYMTDALHVAVASVARADLLVSWNFRHIVNFRKIPLYNAVNALHGYGEIEIRSPREVIYFDE